MTTRFRRGLTTTFTQPYSTRSSARTTQVPPSAPFQVSIGGRLYDVDTEFKPYLRDAFRHRSIAAQREAIDLTNEPGVGTVNVEDLWRREMFDWTLGAGQNYLDRKTSAPNRFWESKGMETALTWQATLLPECVNVKSSSEARMSVLAVADHVYACLGNTVFWTVDFVFWNEVMTTPGGTAAFHGWATNGKTIWMAYGAGGNTNENYNPATQQPAFATPLREDYALQNVTELIGGVPDVLQNHSEPFRMREDDWGVQLVIANARGQARLVAVSVEGFMGPSSDRARV